MTDSKNTMNPRGFLPWWLSPATQGAEAMSHAKLSRRAILAGSAAVSATAIAATPTRASWTTPAVVDATAPDPIFAVIEKYRVIYVSKHLQNGCRLRCSPRVALRHSVLKERGKPVHEKAYPSHVGDQRDNQARQRPSATQSRVYDADFRPRQGRDCRRRGTQSHDAHSCLYFLET
jgi:hypothetical protein